MIRMALFQYPSHCYIVCFHIGEIEMMLSDTDDGYGHDGYGHMCHVEQMRVRNESVIN